MSKPRDPRVGRTLTSIGAVAPPQPQIPPSPTASSDAKFDPEPTTTNEDFGAFNNIPTMEFGSQAGGARTIIAGSGVTGERTRSASPSAPSASPTTAAALEIMPSLVNIVAYQPALELVTAVDSARSAAYRVTRHQLLAQNPGTVMMVTSAQPGEGKSITALNLALAFAELAPGKTLLVEANFRRPWLVNALQLAKYRCFRAQMIALRSQSEMPLGVTQLAPTALHVAPLRPWSAGEVATPFLDAVAIARAMYALRSAGYERIIVDAASTLEAADVNLLQDACDGIVTVVRARETKAAQLQEVIERLSPARFLGTVLT